MMSRLLLLLCGGVSTAYCASNFTQSDFPGVPPSTEAALDASADWTDDPKWCGGRNTIRTIKVGGALGSTYYPFFSAFAMLCYTGDHGFGHQIEEKVLSKLQDDISWLSSVSCDYDAWNIIDGIRSMGLDANYKTNGFGRVTLYCVNAPASNVTTDHSGQSLNSPTTYYLTCPGLQVLIGAQTVFDSVSGFQRARAWCGSIMYYHHMASYGEPYPPLVSVGDYPPGMYFADYESGDPYRVTSAPVVCEEDTFVSGLDFIRSMNNEFYNILLHCSDGATETSMVSGSALVPADKLAEATRVECIQSSSPIPIQSLYIMSSDNSDFEYGMPGMTVECINETLFTYHNSSYEPGFDDIRLFKNLYCPLNTVMAGYVPIYTVRENQQGIYTLQLVCRNMYRIGKGFEYEKYMPCNGKKLW